MTSRYAVGGDPGPEVHFEIQLAKRELLGSLDKALKKSHIKPSARARKAARCWMGRRGDLSGPCPTRWFKVLPSGETVSLPELSGRLARLD